MVRAFVAGLLTIMLMGGIVRAQTGPVDPPASPVLPEGAGCNSCCDRADRVWFSADYLLWWVKDQPLSTPLLTTGTVQDARPAVLGQPGTRVLIGDRLDWDAFSGLRLAGGVWLDDSATLGLEAGGLCLPGRSVSQGFSSDAGGNPVLSRPFLDPTGRPGVYDAAFPGAVRGGFAATATSELYGWEVSGVANLLRTCEWQADLLVGCRALYLSENLDMLHQFTPLVNNLATFQGAPAPGGSLFRVTDRFATSNDFYGGQIGGRLTWNRGIFSVGVLGKVALGSTWQRVNVAGQTRFFGPGAVQGATPVGLLAGATNSGSQEKTAFAVAPEVGVNVGANLTSWLRVQAGYSFLYISSVVRPGDQIDPTLNPRNVPIDQAFAPGGPARPMPLFDRSDFYAHGVNFSLLVSY